MPLGASRNKASTPGTPKTDRAGRTGHGQNAALRCFDKFSNRRLRDLRLVVPTGDAYLSLGRAGRQGQNAGQRLPKGRTKRLTFTADAAPEVKAISKFISEKAGGKGAVRDPFIAVFIFEERNGNGAEDFVRGAKPRHEVFKGLAVLECQFQSSSHKALGRSRRPKKKNAFPGHSTQQGHCKDMLLLENAF